MRWNWRNNQWSSGRVVEWSRRALRSTTRPLDHLTTAIVITLLVTTSHAQPKQTDLDRLRNEINQLRQRLDDVKAQTKTAQQELEEVDLELGIRTRELALAIDMEQRLDGERAALEAQIASLGPRIARQKHFLAKRLAALYRLGSLSYLRMFLAIDQQRDPLEAMSMLSYVVSRDARAVSRFQAEQQQLSARYFDLADRRKRLDDMRRVVEQRRQAVAAAHEQKQRMLASLQSEQSGTERRVAELEEKARRLERLVDTLARQRAGMPVTADVRALQGALGWPVEGKILEGFGRQRDPKFSTVTVSNGLKIGAAPGAPVRAVFQGTVLFSQWFKGYGNLIIVDHGNRVFSLYGNLKAPAVAIGDRIATGQTIAQVGESDDAAGGYLYFEIRQNNQPDDPRKWLR
jgi:murein hydrolase activator